MVFQSLSKLLVPTLRQCRVARPVLNSALQFKRCYSVFGIQDLIVQEKPDFVLEQVRMGQHSLAIDVIKKYYLPEHVLVKSRNMNLGDDRAIDEYLVSVLKQGNSIFARAQDGKIAGICVGFASCPIDAKNLRNYAFYRQVRISPNKLGQDAVEYTKIEIQDPNTKDFLYFTAKLQETPNLWETFKQQKIYEIRMLAVVPEFRRQGLAGALVEASKAQAHDQGFNVIRMDCINPYDFKVAERCMLHCVVKFPLHRLRGANAPFVRRSSPHNRCVRVYVEARPQADSPDVKTVKERQAELESLIE